MAAARESLFVRLLKHLSRLVREHPRWFIWPQVLLFAACLWFTFARLEFDMDRNSLVDSKLQYHKNFLALKARAL